MMKISELLEQHDIKAIDSNGNALIHLVIKNEEYSLKETLESLEILLDTGVDPNIKNKNEESVLHLAIARRNKDVIDFLITREVQYDDSIAEYMIRNEKENFYKLLHDLQISDSDMQKANRESASFFDWIIAKELFDIDSVNNDGESALILALKFHLLHLLPVLLKYTRNINYIEPKTNRTLLHIFIENNASIRHRYRASNFVLREISKCRLYPNYIRRHAMDVVKAMLNNGISLDTPGVFGNTALHVAISNEENIGIIELLIESSTDVNQKNLFQETPFNTVLSKLLWLHESQTHEHFRLLQSLIAKNADVNERHKYGRTYLSIAVKRHHLQAVEFLKDIGADFSVINEDGETLLHLFVAKLEFTVAEVETRIKWCDVLISNGCKVNAKDIVGRTALDTAAKNGDSVIVKKLIECGANINCKNSSGETSLSKLAIDNQQICRVYTLNMEGEVVDVSARHRNPEVTRNLKMLELLLKYGADFSTKVNSGYSILYIALLKFYNEYRHVEPPISPCELPSLNECLEVYPNYEVEFLLNHWIKLEVANLKCNTGFEYADLMKKEEYKMVDQKCRNEIKILKDTFIDRRTTLYTFLHMDLNSRRTFMNNEKLQNILQSPKFEEEYPEYSVLIFARYHEALTRKSLMDPAKNVWLELTNIQLPDICVELIFSFLSNVELFDFIEGI